MYFLPEWPKTKDLYYAHFNSLEWFFISMVRQFTAEADKLDIRTNVVSWNTRSKTNFFLSENYNFHRIFSWIKNEVEEKWIGTRWRSNKFGWIESASIIVTEALADLTNFAPAGQIQCRSECAPVDAVSVSIIISLYFD